MACFRKVRWTLFWSILFINFSGRYFLDEMDLDDLDDEEIIKNVKMTPKTIEDVYETKKVDPSTEEIDEVEDITHKFLEKVQGVKDIHCIDFQKYSRNCTVGAALIYNSPRVTPPLPSKINDWCKSIRYLTRCAIDWNTECNESTDNLFNEHSIKGHMHVLDNICDDEWFLGQYREVSECVVEASGAWEDCYTTFKLIVEEQKNITRPWTHYETHFYLCCAQAQFRRCTLDFLFKMPKCQYGHAITIQKFSVIISEGDIYQECNNNIVYANCPSGDPTPTQQQLKTLMDSSLNSEVSNTDSTSCNILFLFSSQLILIKFFM